MDPLGRCIIDHVIFLILAALFSACAALLYALRSLDANEDTTSAASRLYPKKNAYRLRLSASGALCLVISGSALWSALGDRIVSALVGHIPALSVWLCTILVAALLSIPMLLLGVFLPWAIAERRVDSDRVYRFVRIAKNLAFVFVLVPELCFRLISRIFGIEPDNARLDVTEEEILQLVDEGENSGAIDSEQREMIENIFDFSEQSVREVMTHYMDVTAIRSDATDEDIIALIGETGYSRYPVYEDDITRVTGILIAKEYLCDRLSDSPRPFSSLVRTPLFVPESAPTDTVLAKMKDLGQHMAFVVNEYGEAVGIATMEDLLEEIVGSIYDETDTSDDREPEAVALGEGEFEVDAMLSLDDLERKLGISLTAADGVDTVGALVFSKLTTIPDDGVTIDVETNELFLHSDGLADRRLDKVTLRVKNRNPSDESKR